MVQPRQDRAEEDEMRRTAHVDVAVQTVEARRQ